MTPASLGMIIGLAGGFLRACLGFMYKKVKAPKTRFIPMKFVITLIECSLAGLGIGLLVEVTDFKTGLALALAAAGVSEIAGKTGLHDLLGIKNRYK
ncbi:MAG: hypothetical protein KJ955_02660 [Nanoarchaeota archaeon]|nr:hypothetical protein [Nanoarchaeota archaeon]